MNSQTQVKSSESLDEFLDRQLKTFRRCLKDACLKAARNIEHVHQLRVSSRRLLQAIRVVQPLAEPELCRWFEKNVRRVLKTAGKARDLDLLIEAESRREDRSSRSVVKRWMRQRKKLQKKLCRRHTSLCRRGLRQRSNQLLKSITTRASLDGAKQTPLSQTWYRESLREVAMPFVDGIQSATHLETIHELRIAGKKFRYTLELIGPLLDANLAEQIVGEMKSLQEQLGLLQDYVVARNAFHRLIQRRSHRHDRDELSRRMAQLDQQIAECTTGFQAWQQSADSRKLVRDVRKLCGVSNRKSEAGAR